MKKVAALISSLGFLVTAATAFAVSPTPISIRVVAPLQGVNPSTTIGTLLSNILTIVFVLAAIVVLFMLIIGAFQWITSGGDKEAVAGARNRLTFAIIGITILALAFVMIRVLGQITGFEFFAGQNP